MQGESEHSRSFVTAAGALVAVGGGAVLGLAVASSVGTFLGMLVGGFLLGLVVSGRPLRAGAAAAVTATLVILAAAGVPGSGVTGGVAALGSVAPGTLAVSIVLSAAAGGFGVHLGDDLREGLSTPLPETESPGKQASPEARGAPEQATRPSSGDAAARRHPNGEDADTDTDADADTDTDADAELARESIDE